MEIGINSVTPLTEDMNKYNEVCYLCNKIEFAVFKIKNLTGKYSDLGSDEEITKAKQFCNKPELCPQEKLTFWKLFLETMDKASKAKSGASAIKKKNIELICCNKHPELLIL